MMGFPHLGLPRNHPSLRPCVRLSRIVLVDAVPKAHQTYTLLVRDRDDFQLQICQGFFKHTWHYDLVGSIPTPLKNISQLG